MNKRLIFLILVFYTKKTIKKTLWYIMALIIIGSFFFLWSKSRNLETKEMIVIKKENAIEVVPAEPVGGDIIKEEASKESSKAESETSVETKLPEKILIDVQFTSQAPFGKWDNYHEEACEEASLLMVAYFIKNKKLTAEVAEKEIQALIAYQLKTVNKFEDSTAEETAKLGKDYYDLKNLRVVYDFTVDDLKKYLAQKKPIIVPAAGRRLGNPNFTAPGPLYHNLVLVGYDGDTIITNDPGTRKGQGYLYDIKTLYGAIHDFPGDKEKIETGRKAMIVVE